MNDKPRRWIYPVGGPSGPDFWFFFWAGVSFGVGILASLSAMWIVTAIVKRLFGW